MQTEIIQKTDVIKDLEEQLEILTTEKTKVEFGYLIFHINSQNPEDT